MNQESQPSSGLVSLIGGLGILMVAAGVIVGAVQALRPEPDAIVPADVPALTLLSPATGDTVDAPVQLRFTAGDRLALGGMGWASDELHIHAYVDGREIMPAAADIQSKGDGTFRWTLPLEPGTRTIQLRWAGMNHGAIEAGASDAVEILAR